jgi:hypothetical protein
MLVILANPLRSLPDDMAVFVVSPRELSTAGDAPHPHKSRVQEHGSNRKARVDVT